MEKKKFLKEKRMILIFAALALLSGFLFLNENMTGNAILNNHSVNLISLIGLLLVICSAILVVYFVKKR